MNTIIYSSAQTINKTLDFRNSKDSLPSAIEKYQNARVIILNAPQMNQLPSTISSLSELHTVVCVDPQNQFHRVRLGSLIKTPEVSETDVKEGSRTIQQNLAVFEQRYINSFESQVLTGFHDYMLRNTRNLTGDLYHRHVEQLQEMFDESSKNVGPSGGQSHQFKAIVNSGPATPLKKIIRKYVLPNIKPLQFTH